MGGRAASSSAPALRAPRKGPHSGDLAHLVIIRNDFIEAERIEKLPLVPVEPPHHRSPPQRIASERRNHRSRKPSTIFATKSATNGLMRCNKIVGDTTPSQTNLGQQIGTFTAP